MKALVRRFGKLLGLASSPKNTEEICLDNDKANDKPYIISSFFYLAVIGLIGLPMWYYTCSITRHPLPNLRTLESKLNSDAIEFIPRLHLDVSVVDLNRYDATKRIDDETPFTDPRADILRTKLNKYHLSFDSKTSYNISWRIRRPLVREYEAFKHHLSKEDLSLVNLEVDLTKIHKPVNKFRLFIYLIQEEHHERFCEQNLTKTEGGYTIGYERFLFICPPVEDTQEHNILVDMIQSLLHYMYVGSVHEDSTRHVKYGELDLLLSLIPEPTDQRSITELPHLATIIHYIYQKNLEVNFLDLKELVNIRLIVQNVIDLLDLDTFRKIGESSKRNNDAETSLLALNTFDKLLHNFESRVSKHSTQGVYNAILLDLRFSRVKLEFESDIRSNLLQTKDSSSVLLINDEKSLVLGLRSLIRSIVGLRGSISKNIIRSDIFFSRWEIDALLGYLTLKKLHETLNSLTSISQQVMGVKIPKEVSAMAEEANILALKSIDRLRTKHSLDAYRLASRALKVSDMAYYDPSLLESLYFPDELKYAIYLPLFLPLALPLIMSLYRLVRFLLDCGDRNAKKLKIH